jgi:hypothetical protein
MGVGGQRHASVSLPPGKRTGTNFIGNWIGTRTRLDRRGKSRPYRDRPIVQSVVSQSTHYAILAHYTHILC